MERRPIFFFHEDWVSASGLMNSGFSFQWVSQQIKVGNLPLRRISYGFPGERSFLPQHKMIDSIAASADQTGHSAIHSVITGCHNAQQDRRKAFVSNRTVFPYPENEILLFSVLPGRRKVPSYFELSFYRFLAFIQNEIGSISAFLVLMSVLSAASPESISLSSTSLSTTKPDSANAFIYVEIFRLHNIISLP